MALALENKIALVTGVSGEGQVGIAVAKAMAAEGASLGISARNRSLGADTHIGARRQKRSYQGQCRGTRPGGHGIERRCDEAQRSGTLDHAHRHRTDYGVSRFQSGCRNNWPNTRRYGLGHLDARDGPHTAAFLIPDRLHYISGDFSMVRGVNLAISFPVRMHEPCSVGHRPIAPEQARALLTAAASSGLPKPP